ncbi:MAG: CoA pyrophosphatase [Rhodospirillales bacterium]|nr:CoA pyrophosphatase [Rhodospirillales bacterium]
MPDHPVVPIDIGGERGDHNLNSDMEPFLPLKPAAVLIPLVDRPEGLSVLLTRRTAHLAHHAGQVSFPGGHIEPADEGPADTALRETEEEVGIDRRSIEVLGHLDVYVTRTGFVVTPVVALVHPPFTLRPDDHEVDEVFEVPLAFLLDPANHQKCSAEFEGVTRYFYAMPYGRHFIWGATAGMLVNLYEVLCKR